MISRKIRHNRFTRITILFATFGIVILLTLVLDGAFQRENNVSRQLLIQGSSRLPIIELSGLFFNPQNRLIYGVGDANSEVSISRITSGGLKLVEKFNIADAIGERFFACTSLHIPECARMQRKLTSQWEGLAIDGDGRFFLLNEQLSTIFVYNRDSDKIESLINLTSFPSEKINRQRSSVDHNNALAEGFILLKNGHILVIKERYPASINEFAPSSESTAIGYHAGDQLQSHQSFVTIKPGRNEYSLVKSWSMPAGYNKCDLSELTADRQGHLYVLSQQCGWIGQVKDLKVGKHSQSFELATTWTLPTNIRSAEALAIIDNQHFLVGVDLKSQAGDNIYLLKRSNNSEISTMSLANSTDP